tara:strand:- start:2941 stop:3333 length:393 start_codon:yes stop_codon:yes gene_type:complete
LDNHLNVDDVQISADHLSFNGHWCVGYTFSASEAELQSPNQVGPNDVFIANGAGPPPVEAILSYRSYLGFTEEAQDCLLSGAGGIDAGRGPDHDNQADEQGDGHTNSPATQSLGNTPDSGADVANDLFEI